MNNVFYPGGQPYTPPRELTEEELEQYLEELKKKKREEREKKEKEG